MQTYLPEPAPCGPAGRDRYADLLRIVAIAMVVLGHWLVVVVLVQDGSLVTGRLLSLRPWTQWATWVFQVMPVFFIVGGFVNARSWNRALQRGEPWTAWIRRRSGRLLRPLLPLLVFWPPFTLGLLLAGLSPTQVRLATQAAFVPLWFLGIYLAVIALVPLTWKLHRRLGFAAVVPFVAAAATVDALARAGVPLVEHANSWIVWVGIHQIGYLWHDARLPTRATPGLALTAVSLAALLALVTLGGYPISMVTVEAGERSNASPPTLALFALALVQLGLIVAAQRPLRRWLERPGVTRVVAAAGSVLLTVFLWHMTALLLVAAIAYLTGLWPAIPEINATWWALRPLWLMLCSLVLAGLVLLFRRFENLPDPPPCAARARTLAGLAATLAGLALLVREGLYEPEGTVLRPMVTLALLFGGLAALGVPHSSRRPAPRCVP